MNRGELQGEDDFVWAERDGGIGNKKVGAGGGQREEISKVPTHGGD